MLGADVRCFAVSRLRAVVSVRRPQSSKHRTDPRVLRRRQSVAREGSEKRRCRSLQSRQSTSSSQCLHWLRRYKQCLQDWLHDFSGLFTDISFLIFSFSFFQSFFWFLVSCSRLSWLFFRFWVRVKMAFLFVSYCCARFSFILFRYCVKWLKKRRLLECPVLWSGVKAMGCSVAYCRYGNFVIRPHIS